MVYIKNEKAEKIIAARHPWIFTGSIERVDKELSNGMLTAVKTNKEKIIGWGYYSKDSRIAVRMITYTPEKPGASWIEEHIESAFQARKALHINSNAYRLVNGEGDFIPGLVIDLYNQTTVIRPLTKAMELSIDKISCKLKALFPGNLLFIKRDEYTARKENITLANGYLEQTGTGKELITENGINFIVDIAAGQKTGFYLDQRENRNLLKELARDKTVLNLFSYTGGFSLYAAAGGAKGVLSVDSSAQALELCRQNLEQNPLLKACSFSRLKADVLLYIKESMNADIIILDPPPFARKQGEIPGALKGYKFLNRMAIEKVARHGILFTFSCSGVVDKTAFYNTLKQAGKEAGRKLRMVKELHAASDHPVSIYHPEGEYLKGWILYVE